VLILALDTTTRGGSVAVARDDEVLAVREGDAARTHAERLPAEIDGVLAAAAVPLRALDLLVVASGPGGFTGLRIGLAAIQGLAMALERPTVGVSAFDALVQTRLVPGARQTRAFDERIATWLDAGRGEVYAALYEAAAPDEDGVPWRQVQAASVASPQRVLDRMPRSPAARVTIVGDGAARYAELIRRTEPRWMLATDLPPLAPALAWIGRRRAERGHAGPPHALQPLYVRRPDAEVERDRRPAP
jgi:tRNA threonylcarbamoyladenosine biosynthesis protein TsaB